MRRSFQECLVKLVQMGLSRLKRYGQTDDLGRRTVYLAHPHGYCSIEALDWEVPRVDRSSGLFFKGTPRPWWSPRRPWNWQTPSHPKWVKRQARHLLPGVRDEEVRRVLRILRSKFRVITREEFLCATLFSADG